MTLSCIQAMLHDFKNASHDYFKLIFSQRTELFQRNLASTSCLMDLQFSPDKPQARILHLTQPTSLDVSEMIRHVGALL